MNFTKVLPCKHMQVYHTGIVHCFHDSVSVVHVLVFLLFRLYVTAIAPLDPGMFVLLTLCLTALISYDAVYTLVIV